MVEKDVVGGKCVRATVGMAMRQEGSAVLENAVVVVACFRALHYWERLAMLEHEGSGHTSY